MSQFIRPDSTIALPSASPSPAQLFAALNSQKLSLLVLFALLPVIALAPGCQKLQRQSVITKLPPPPFRIKQAQAVALASPLSTGTPVSRSRYPRSAPATLETASPGPGWIPARASDRWKCIVVHHSATPEGNAAEFDRLHRRKGWDELGYHFVIGNGRGSGNGQIEVGSRWKKQKHGAHAKTADNWYNDHGIGICLVGNFDKTYPTDRQMEALARLIAFLQSHFSLDSRRVYGHGDVKVTDCPGHNFSFSDLNRRLQRYFRRPTAHRQTSRQPRRRPG